MKITTRIFGEVEIADDKIICFENGIIGFPELKKFALKGLIILAVAVALLVKA